MVSSFARVLYYSPKAKIPTIVRPFSNSHWQSSRVVPFSWIYNGFDLQLEFQIEIYAFNEKGGIAIPFEWENLVEDGNDNVSAFVGSPIITVTDTTTIQAVTINANVEPFLSFDGSYLYRLRVKGNVANEWSDWNPSGRLNIDATSPLIKNLSFESSTDYNESGEPAFASNISDMGAPYIFTSRTYLDGAGASKTAIDRHVDRAGSKGLYIYYDYRDNAIVLRASRGGSEVDSRYYGQITFHATEGELSPDFNISSAIKSAYLYEINRNFEDGPHELSRLNDQQKSNELIGESIEKIIYTAPVDLNFTRDLTNEYIPLGFPTFWTRGVFHNYAAGGESTSTSPYLDHPLGFRKFHSHFSVFPLSTRIVTRILKFTNLQQTSGWSGRPGNNLDAVTYSNVIEMRYPAPYHDLFILFDETMARIEAYGQYLDTDLGEVASNEETKIFELRRGLDVSGYRDANEEFDINGNGWFNWWEAHPDGATSYKNNPNKRGPFADADNFIQTVGGPSINQQFPKDIIRSHTMYFNLHTSNQFDNALKIYIRPKALFYPECASDTQTGGFEQIDFDNLVTQISFIEFNMGPKTDHTFVLNSGGVGDAIPVDEVFVGKAKISPKAFSYLDGDPTKRDILFDSKTPPMPFLRDIPEEQGRISDVFQTIAKQVRKWGCGPDDINFNDDRDGYNAAFRIRIPAYKFIPYYHPGSVNRSVDPLDGVAITTLNPDTDQSPIPHIFNTEPNQDTTSSVIGWDKVVLSTKSKSTFENSGYPQADMVYPGDVVRFMGTARAMGQINPYLYNFTKWGELNKPRGTISRVRGIGKLLNPMDYYHFGRAMVEDGWSPDGIFFNGIDRGIYIIGDIDRTDTVNTSNLYLQNFSNHLFKRSLEVALTPTPPAITTDFTSTEEWTTELFVRSGANTTLLETTTDPTNDTADTVLTYKLLGPTTADALEYRNAIISGDDTSIQSHYGIDRTPLSSWMEDASNPFSGHYLIARQGNITTPVISSITGVASGPNDIVIEGNYTGTIGRTYLVQVVSIAPNPDTFRWSDDNGVSWSGTTNMSVVAIVLSNGVTVRWVSANAHLDGTQWTFGGSPQDSASQIKRVAAVSGNNFNYTTMSPINRKTFLTAPDATDTDYSLHITGDTFSMGNVFGQIVSTNNGKLRLFFDIEESNAGIDSVKIFQVDIETAPIVVDSSNQNLIKSSQYIGSKDIDGVDQKISILMQKLNNRKFDLTDINGSTNGIQAAIDALSNTRSPFSLVEYHFNNNILLWDDASSSTRTCINATSGSIVEEKIVLTSDKPGFFHEISVNGTGLKFIYVQVKDRSGNVSNIYPVPIFISTAASVEPAKDIKSITMSVDDGQVIKGSSTRTVSGTIRNFENHLLTSDTDKARSIVVKKIIVEDSVINDVVQYKNIDFVNDLLMGLSDDYGISYGTYIPFSSISSWRFTRPIGFRVKHYDADTRFLEPGWFFDPNDVRFYSTSTPTDFSFGINSDSSNKNNGPGIDGIGTLHLPKNNSFNSFTLLGFKLQSKNTTTAPVSNPIAEKLLEYREEFIGKDLVLGNIPNESFKILHVFETDDLIEIKTLDSNGDIIANKTIDDDRSNKVWVVVDDPEGICSLVASRKFQYISSSDSRLGPAKQYTFSRGRDQFVTGIDSTKYTSFFGYEDEEALLIERPAVNESVNQALNMLNSEGILKNDATPGGPFPISDLSQGFQSIYIVPSTAPSDSSGISSDEGWTTRIFGAFSRVEGGTDPLNTLEQLEHHQLIGMKTYNKMIFGKVYNVIGTINQSESQFLSTEGVTAFKLSTGAFDSTMINMTYSIKNVTSGLFVDLSSLDVSELIIRDVSITGDVVVVGGDLFALLSLPDANVYEFHVSVAPLDSTSAVTGNLLDRGWWPSIDGIPVPPNGSRFGSVSLNDTINGRAVKFAAISTGSFYIGETGDYTFKIDIDTNPENYADFCIDYMRVRDSLVQDLVEQLGSTSDFVFKNVGGCFSYSSADNEKTFYLTKGWHIGRFRYVTKNTNSHAHLLYRKPNWANANSFVPMMGDNSGSHTFMTRSFRSIHCRILDEVFTQYPSFTLDRTKSTQYCRAVVGFVKELEDVSSAVTINQVAKIDRERSDPNNATSSFVNFGKRVLATPSEGKPTFSAQLTEEIFSIYESNIFDAGSDFRFWKTLNWTPAPGDQPSGTTVQFQIRTANITEGETVLLQKKWNNIGTESAAQIIAAFTQSGADIIRFSFPISSKNPQDLEVNRFIQFRMVLSSRVADVTPTVDDVTISYSKQNSVNFFTTTFSLQSNLKRAILTYNGDKPIDPSGVSLTDIQFGLSTEEVTAGVVSSNFDNYKLIPNFEAFSLSSLGIPENKNFRIGIRLVSSSEAVPVVDEWALMIETDGNPEQLQKGL